MRSTSMKIHIQNIGECQKCGLILSRFFGNISDYGLNLTFTDDPRECNILIIVGCLLRTQLNSLIQFWKEMPKNSQIISFGNCGSELQKLFNLNNNELKNQTIYKDDLEEIIPIDNFIEGCPPELERLIEFFKNTSV